MSGRDDRPVARTGVVATHAEIWYKEGAPSSNRPTAKSACCRDAPWRPFLNLTMKLPHRFGTIVLTILLTWFSGSGVALGQADSASEGIAAWHQKFVQSAEKGDAAAAAALYTEDAMLFPPNSPAVKGRKAVEQDLVKYFAWVRENKVKIEIKSIEVQQFGDTAYNLVAWVDRGPDGKVFDQGVACGIWKRVQGSWKLHRDTIQSSIAKKE